MSTILEGVCQETVFKLFKQDITIANEYLKDGNFQGALNLYLNDSEKRHPVHDIHIKIARCYYFLKQYDKAIISYNKNSSELALPDVYNYAEAQAAVGNYKRAIEYYKIYLNKKPDDALVLKKIWNLSNVQFLYEDSSYYDIHLMSINSAYGEFCAVPYDSGIVFSSNRKGIGGVEQMDASLGIPFYKIYYVRTIKDSLIIKYSNPKIFSKAFNFKFHTGPVAFYQQSEKMVFVTAGEESETGHKKTLQLYFARKKDNQWQITGSFPYNSAAYSNSDPTISEDGTVLFFSSNMKGGKGGKDIYKSTFVNGDWTKPINIGEPVNTAYNEVFPYLHANKTLYFSSDGHAGLGALDIFKSSIYEDRFGEVQNVGYPLNSNLDDYGIVIDSLYNHGYLTSNRENGGFDDNIYEFTMNLQSYPLEISGVIKYIEHSWVDSSELKVLPDVKILLIDNIRNITVSENRSDNLGNFKITIPYASKYKIRVTGDEIGEGIISFDIPKHAKLNDKYEIVVVKDEFKSYENELK